MSWDAQDILPGQSETFVMAAYGPRGVPWKISYAMDSTRREGSNPANPTTVPGSNIVSWLNQVNSVCSGDVAPPDQ